MDLEEKTASISHYDSKADKLTPGASPYEKQMYENAHNGYGWMLFYKELYPELAVPYMRWDGVMIDLEEYIHMDDDSEEGRWITTKEGHKVHLNEEGEPDKGNPYVIAAMEGGGESSKNTTPKPASRIKFRKSTLSNEKRSEFNSQFSDLSKRMTEANKRVEEAEKKIQKEQKGIPYNKRDFTELWDERKKRDEITSEVKSLVETIPEGTLCSFQGLLLEKTGEGWMSEGPRKDGNGGKPIKESEIARWFACEGYLKEADTPEFIESTDDLKMVRAVELKSDDKYESFAKNINNLDKKGVVARAKKDPEFKELVDAVTLYTQGAYREQKEEAKYLVEHGLDEAQNMTVADFYGDGYYDIKQLWTGQNLRESRSSFSEGVVSMIGAINNSEPTENALYRICDDRGILTRGGKVYVPPKVGDRISMDAPTSFTKEKSVMDDIKDTKAGDIVYYKLEPGARALDIERLSRYKQAESLTCGEFEVTGVSVKPKKFMRVQNAGEEHLKQLEGRETITDYFGKEWLCTLETTVTIRQVGKTEFGKRKDDSLEYYDCHTHFDNERWDGNAEEGRWITTENGHHIHLNEEGDPDKGNPHVIEAMTGGNAGKKEEIGSGGKTATKALGYGKTIAERQSFRKKQFDDFRKKLSEQYPVLKMRKEIMDSKHYYVRMCDNEQKRLEKEGPADKLEELKEARKPFDHDFEVAKKDYEDARQELIKIGDEYKKERDKMNAAILEKYPDYDSIHNGEEAGEYLLAKGYFSETEMEDPRHQKVEGMPKFEGRVMLDGFTPELARETAKTVDKIYSMYPEIAQNMRNFSEYDIDSSGEYGNGSVTVNSKEFSDNSYYKDNGLDLPGFHPVIGGGSEYRYQMATIAHEFGHALDDWLTRKHPDSVSYIQVKDAFTTESKETVAPLILKQAAKNLGITQAELKRRVSRYACKNAMEALAEAFSEYVVSDDPRPETAEIGRQIDAFYKTGKTVGKR